MSLKTVVNNTASRVSSLEFWLYSLISGFIGGGATAAMSAGGLATAHASGLDVPVLNFKAIGIIFLSAGVSNALAYLAKSPLPPITQSVVTDSTTVQSAGVSATHTVQTISDAPTNKPTT